MANRGSYIVRDNNRTYDPKKIAFGVNNVSVSMATHMADIFYLPKSKLSHFHFLSDLFHRNKIFLGKYFKAMANKTASDFTHSIETLAFEKLALLDRHHFAHPVKINKMDNKRYCQVMIQKIWIEIA